LTAESMNIQHKHSQSMVAFSRKSSFVLIGLFF